jgi:hypothetical protein
VLVRVTDTDRSGRNDSTDTVAVDAVVITTTNPGPPLPEITVIATDPAADESGDPGAFSFTRDISDSLLSVGYSIGGTATNGVDYALLSGTVDFPAGVFQVIVEVVPVDDTVAGEGSETVSVTVAPGAGYDVGPESTAIVTIADNDSTGGGEFRTGSEQTTYGTITSGGYVNTWFADTDFESITEESYAGGNRARLEHTWTISGITGTSATLAIDAVSTGEPFTFDISLDGGSSWIPAPAPTSDFSLNGATTLLVRVTDTNRNKGDTTPDTIRVDQILLTN